MDSLFSLGNRRCVLDLSFVRGQRIFAKNRTERSSSGFGFARKIHSAETIGRREAAGHAADFSAREIAFYVGAHQPTDRTAGIGGGFS